MRWAKCRPRLSYAGGMNEMAVAGKAGKFRDPDWTAGGEPRASVALEALRTLWINTGSLCNIECRNCYIDSSPVNDRLAYISRAEAAAFLDEIWEAKLPEKAGDRLLPAASPS